MAIFPNLILEPVVQVNDKTRLDATKSYISNETEDITKVEISPDGGVTYADVTGNINARSPEWWLDYQFATDGVVDIRCRVTVGGLIPVTSVVQKTLQVISVADDHLFSSDSDLVAIEPDIMKYVSQGRSSWLREHRRAQTEIVAWLNKNGVTDMTGSPITKANVLDVSEVREWSTYLVLKMIFNGLSNSDEDVYAKKAVKFGSAEVDARYRYALRLDLDNDDMIGLGEGIMLQSIKMLRR